MEVLNEKGFDLKNAAFPNMDTRLKVIRLEAGEPIHISSSNKSIVKIYWPQHTMTMMVYKYKKFLGKQKCSGIRQVIHADVVCQNHSKPNSFIRKICAERGAKEIKIIEGCPPLTKLDEVAIPNFKFIGSNWYIMPLSIFKELGGELC